MEKSKRAQLGSVSAVTSIFLTGAFILGNFGVPPVLPTAFEIITGQGPPIFYGLALGAIGAYDVLYQVLYTFLISPIDCMTKEEIKINSDIDFDTIERTDIINIIVVFFLYNWLLFNQNTWDNLAVLGGLLVILSSIATRIVPRVVANKIEYDCYWTIKVVLVSIPASVILYIPSMVLINLGT